jgi:hypothetical protein
MTTTITALPAATALAGTEVFPADQAGVTSKVTANQIKTFTGNAPLSVTDGSTTVATVTSINFISGATVSSGGAGIADVAVAGGGGGGGNVTPDSHPGTAATANDEFEGGAIDLVGTRFLGALAWTWSNQGSATAVLKKGSLVLGAPGDGASHFLWQTAAAAPWRHRLRVTAASPSSTTGSVFGFVLYNSGSTSNYLFGQEFADGKLRLHKFTGPSTYVGSPYTSLPLAMIPYMPVYLEIENDGTSLYFRVSASGVDGSFEQVFTETLAAYITSVTNIGVMANSGNAAAVGLIDWFRREA